ncbi:PQQ-binding-like beta-propeller repeat protein [bacterium]|nr:PQQ-binding-like beta-propeller repeat protein [bacterium]
MYRVLLFLCLLPISVLAQERSLDLTMKFKDIKGSDLAGIKITLIETTSGAVVELTTNKQGLVHTVLDSGYRWSINFLDIKEYDFVELPQAGVRTQNRTITYIPAKYRESTERADRSNVKFNEIKQYTTSSSRASKTHNLLALKVVDKEKRGEQGIALAVVNVEQKAKYTAKTNAGGWAYFLLPPGYKYEIDVPGIEGYKTVDIPKENFVEIELEVLFVPTHVDEKLANDTIVQNIGPNDKASTERVLMKIFVRNFDGQGLENEKVYWDQAPDGKVYAATTNKDGFAWFMLPKNGRFILNLTYEREIEQFSFDNKNTALASGYIEVTYRGTQVIEDFYNRTHRNAEGMVTEFMETPITKQSITTAYLKPTNDGYVLDFETSSALYTPLVVDGKLYTGHGFYTNDFSCFDAETGRMIWSIKLGEGGSSPAAYYKGYILLITESCSFYLIDAKTGELKWSKWLAPYVLCSPSADDGNLYVVYENDATEMVDGSKRFVLASFEMESGKVRWQKWVDNEGLSAPVVSENSVFLSTQSGTLYEFDKEKGEELHKVAINATSAPTVLHNLLVLNTRVDNNAQSLCFIDRSNWKVQHVATSGKFLPSVFNRMDNMQTLIAYEGSRSLIIDSKMYYTVDNIIFCRDLTGKLLWQKGMLSAPDSISYEIATAPIACGKNVMVGTADGRLLCYDLKTGALQETISIGEAVLHQPALAGGSIYIPLNGTLKVIKTKDKTKDNWPMWYQNGSHNTVFE